MNIVGIGKAIGTAIAESTAKTIDKAFQTIPKSPKIKKLVQECREIIVSGL